MSKPSINRKAEMLREAERAERKAKGYGIEARAYGKAEKGKAAGMSFGALGKQYKAEKEAKNAMANLYEAEAETMRQRASNSRAQYEHERKAGDPSALNLSFEEWKKL
jgi:hypothetical protein